MSLPLGSGRAAAGSWARADRRARWRSLVALGLLAGITAGIALAAVAGAMRTDSALDRLRQRERAADAVVFPSQVGQFQSDWQALAAAPEVDTVAPWALVFGAWGGRLSAENEDGPAVVFAGVDGRYLGATNRPVVVEGRMFDPNAPDEVVIDENIPADLIDVGDVIPFHAFGAGQEPGSGAATGPDLRLRVVGRVRTMAQFLFVTDGQVMASPALLSRHEGQLVAIENADVRLVHGAGDAAALERTVTRVIAPGVPILDLDETARRIETTMSVERTALIALAAVVALVGLVLIGQALGRSAATITDDGPVLRSVGMTRSELTLAATLPHLLAALVAVVTAFVTAIVASIWFPVGMAGRVDPDRGVHPTWVVLLPGLLVLVVGFLGAAAVLGAWSLRTGRAAQGGGTGSRLVARARAHFPLPIGIGTTMALHAGVGRARVPVRPALIGAIVGVLGVTGALTIDHGLQDALDHPERAGVVWDIDVVPLHRHVTEHGIDRSYVAAVTAVDGVATATVATRTLVELEGAGVQTYALGTPGDHSPPPVGLTLIAGRGPVGRREVALGPNTASRFGVDIGDSVAVGDGEVFRVVGLTLFPTDVHAAFDEGMWLSPEGLESVLPPPDSPDAPEIGREVAVAVDDGHEVDAVVVGVQAAVGDRSELVARSEVPPELANLRNIRTLPVVVAAFLGLVAIAALAHVLATSARRRTHEFAVLRALGVTGRWTRTVLNAQGSTVAFVGLVVGVPLGIAVGRAGWRLVAEQVPLATVAPFAVAALLLVIPLTVLIANLAAVWPGRRLAHQHPASVLRTE